MKVTAILAMDEAGCVGTDTGLPWRIKEEMDHFKASTMGGVVVMGRKTWETIPAKFRPLPGRENVVLSRQDEIALPDTAYHAKSLSEAVLWAAYHHPDKEVFVIGGVDIYLQAIDAIPGIRVLVSEIKGVYEGTVFIPKFDCGGWERNVISVRPEFTVVEHRRK